ncbi:menaquinone biosynthesis protein [Spirillospora sp. NPDC047279]|uniref:menaquinone biosynthetic enzyme MqnA/MqnD family protein n=1 Tax=Spirillospora sp. NPDC047279 TaxID=3155478 RepID=UPI00340CF7C4
MTTLQLEWPGDTEGPLALRRPRLGHISFLNCYPLFWSMTRTGLLTEVDVMRESPEVLSSALVRGELDLGPIALTEYLRHSRDLLILPGIAIGCDGPVLSCNIVSRVPLEKLDGRTVALGSTSRTTVVLAQILLEERFGVRPRYFVSEPDLGTMLDRADAAVVIGDVALRAFYREAAELGAGVYDTGRLWKEWTGLPMVFAVWAVRRRFAEEHPHLTRPVHQALLNARDHGLAEVEAASRQSARWETFTAGELERYFRTLSYDLSPDHFEGIREYARRAAARGSVPAGQEFAFYSG